MRPRSASSNYRTMPVLQIKVKPNCQQRSITEELDGTLTVRLKSPPVDGKANQELIKLLAKKLDLPKSQIRIKSGHGSRSKLVEWF